MASDDWGFFLGAAPGVIYAIRNMIQVRQVFNKAQAIARAHGEFLDEYAYPSPMTDYMYRPSKFIRETDGPGLRAGKELLLAVRDRTIKRHWISAVLLVIGIPIGIVCSMGIEALLTSHG